METTITSSVCDQVEGQQWEQQRSHGLCAARPIARTPIQISASWGGICVTVNTAPIDGYSFYYNLLIVLIFDMLLILLLDFYSLPHV